METQTQQSGLWTWAVAVMKLGAAGATLVAIATAIVMFGAEGEVSTSEALVWDMGMFEQSETQKFASSLKHLGHSAPKAYDYNGNEVYFSNRVVDEEPDELMQEYQRTFVARGLNDKAYTDPIIDATDQGQRTATMQEIVKKLKEKKRHNRSAKVPSVVREKTEAFEGLLTGSVVPTRRTQDRISMSGVLNGADVESMDEAMTYRKGFLKSYSSRARLNEAVDVMRECGYDDPLVSLPKLQDLPKNLRLRQKIRLTSVQHSDLFQHCPEWRQFARRENSKLDRAERGKLFEGFQSIEIYRPEGAESTSVTAVWSDDTFELNKAMENPERGKTRSLDNGQEPSIPACNSCVHQTTFASKDSETNYETNLFTSEQPAGRVIREYNRKLSQKGWEQSTAGMIFDKMLRVSDSPKSFGHRSLILKKGNRRLLVGTMPSSEGERGTRVTTMMEAPNR